METHLQNTLVIIKPDGVQRALVGEIIQRFERVGLRLSAMKMVRPDTAMIERHYLGQSSVEKRSRRKGTQKHNT